jgi:hypothetical protein
MHIFFHPFAEQFVEWPLLTPSRFENETEGNERDWAGTRCNETAAQTAKALLEQRVRFPAAPLRRCWSGPKALASFSFSSTLVSGFTRTRSSVTR